MALASRQAPERTVDWDAICKSMEEKFRDCPEEALRFYRSIEGQAETPMDRAVLLLACATCYARLGNRTESFRCITAARLLNVEDRLLRSQIDFQEANLHLWIGDYQLAVTEYRTIAKAYGDLLCNPEHQDFREEHKMRYAYALAFLGECAEAIPLLSEVAASNADERQRSLLYLGTCLVNSGARPEGQQALLEAANGGDEELSKEAVLRLAQLGTTQ